MYESRYTAFDFMCETVLFFIMFVSFVFLLMFL